MRKTYLLSGRAWATEKSRGYQVDLAMTPRTARAGSKGLKVVQARVGDSDRAGVETFVGSLSESEFPVEVEVDLEAEQMGRDTVLYVTSIRRPSSIEQVATGQSPVRRASGAGA